MHRFEPFEPVNILKKLGWTRILEKNAYLSYTQQILKGDERIAIVRIHDYKLQVKDFKQNFKVIAITIAATTQL